MALLLKRSRTGFDTTFRLTRSRRRQSSGRRISLIQMCGRACCGVGVRAPAVGYVAAAVVGGGRHSCGVPACAYGSAGPGAGGDQVGGGTVCVGG
jgi:hypothetical protein